MYTLILALGVCLCACGNKAEDKSYLIKVIDAQGKGVEGVKLNVCTDTTCTMFTTDQNGEVRPGIAPGEYTVHLLSLPEGFPKDTLKREFTLSAEVFRLEIKPDDR